MYEVYCDEHLIYNTKFDDKKFIIHDAKLDLELNKAGSFSFTIYPSHAKYNALSPLKSIITVYQDDYLIFRGRILNTTKGFYNEKQVLCEGELAFLCDSIQRPYDFLSGSNHTTVEDLFAFFITNHNNQVDESKRFKIGDVSVTDENDYIVRSNEEHSTTWNAINEKLINTLGGYLWVRHEADGNYIDYISDFSVVGNQPVKFGKNLLSIKKENKGEDIATALIPIGAEGIGIESVNGGVDYIYDEKAVNQYGWIFRTETWDDVTSPQNLLTKSQKRLRELSEPLSSIEIGAADLSSIEDFNAFHLGTYVTADSSPHDLDANFIVKKLQITLAKPSANKLTLDGTFESLTQITNAQNLTAEIIKKTDKKTETAIAQTEMRLISLIDQSADAIRLEVGELSNDVNAKLNLVICVDENGVVQSVIGASANIIKFKSNRLTIESDNCELSADGTIKLKAGEIGGCKIVNGVLEVGNANIKEKLTANKIEGKGLVIDNDNFAVTAEGEVTAKSGKIGDLELKDGKLTSVDGESTTVIAPNQVSTQFEGYQKRSAVLANGSLDISLKGQNIAFPSFANFTFNGKLYSLILDCENEKDGYTPLVAYSWGDVAFTVTYNPSTYLLKWNNPFSATTFKVYSCQSLTTTFPTSPAATLVITTSGTTQAVIKPSDTDAGTFFYGVSAIVNGEETDIEWDKVNYIIPNSETLTSIYATKWKIKTPISVPSGDIVFMRDPDTDGYITIGSHTNVCGISIRTDGTIVAHTSDDRNESYIIYDSESYWAVNGTYGNMWDLRQIASVNNDITFCTWLTENGENMLEGTWQFNSTVEIKDVFQSINFTSNGTEYKGIMGVSASGGGIAYYIDPNYYFGYPTNTATWKNEADRIVSFTTAQIVSQEFYAWFTANATRLT